jgi:hypothetical protein
MNRSIWTRRVTAVGAATTFIFATACKSSTEPEEGPPAVPPSSAFLMDFGDFTLLQASADAGSPAAVGLNWGRSALVVGVWNIAIAVTLVAPVTAFAAAVNQTPTWEDDHWRWEYDFSVLGVPHSARLEAAPAGTSHRWDMFISRQGTYEDFAWFSGTTLNDGTGGSIEFRLDPNNPTPFLSVVWTRDVQAATGTIRYTNIVAGAAENGSYIFYGVTTDPTYDAFYDIFGAQLQNLTEIEWNRTTLAGRVMDPNHYQDQAWHCWDGNLDDVTCP